MITVTIEEEQRQLMLLALATLSLQRPGFDQALAEIAKLMDNVVGGRPVMYEAFHRPNADREYRSTPMTFRALAVVMHLIVNRDESFVASLDIRKELDRQAEILEKQDAEELQAPMTSETRVRCTRCGTVADAEEWMFGQDTASVECDECLSTYQVEVHGRFLTSPALLGYQREGGRA